MNHIFTHPGQPEMQVEVILASKGPDQKPIYTIRMRYPRIIHGEVLTHRLFSRNARSSRAVPVKTMLNEVRTTPFVPWHWGANQKGMQAGEECNELVETMCYYTDDDNDDYLTAEKLYRHEAWLADSNQAVIVANAFMDAGYHKQIVNRLIEPFSWIEVLITSTDWSNFLWLRDHKDAEPHLQDLARLVKQAIDEAKIYELQSGEWHLPYITPDDRNAAYYVHENEENPDSCDEGWNWLQKISAARCARISYKPFDGDSSYEKELTRYDMLVTSERIHGSPLEHQATPDTFSNVEKTRLSTDEHSDDEELLGVFQEYDNPHLSGNLEGYIQARKLIPNERA